MAKIPDKTAVDHLKQYGFNITDKDGGLVRIKHGRVHEKFAPIDGGYELHRIEPVIDPETNAISDQWVKKLHHVDLGPNGEHIPNFLWPEEHVAHIYRAAVDPDYHEEIATKHRWDLESGALVPRETTED